MIRKSGAPAALPPIVPDDDRAPDGSEAALAHATPFHFLPQSIGTLCQQLLVVALVLALRAEKNLKTIAILYALLFGGPHLLLVFGGASFRFALRFGILAEVFGPAFAFLLSRVPSGWAFACALRFGFYAFIIFLGRGLGLTPRIF